MLKEKNISGKVSLVWHLLACRWHPYGMQMGLNKHTDISGFKMKGYEGVSRREANVIRLSVFGMIKHLSYFGGLRSIHLDDAL